MPGPLADVIADVERLQREFIKSAAKRFDEIAADSAVVAVGAGGVMNIRGPRGPKPTKLRTKPQFIKTGVVATVIVRGKPLGPWVWIEDGTKAHDIAPKRSVGRGKGKRLKVLGGPNLDHPVAGVVHHKGSHGKRAWSRAVAQMGFQVDQLIDREAREVFGGR